MGYYNFNDELSKFISELDNIKIMALATSYKDRVTARNMSVINIGEFIYFQTDKTMDKAEQIINNRNVALCSGFIQIEGTAEILGSWDNNKDILTEYKKRHNSSYEKYKNVKTEVVIKVSPRHVKIWKYLDNIPHIYEMDFDKKTIKLEEYKID